MLTALALLTVAQIVVRDPALIPQSTWKREADGWVYVRVSGTPREVGYQVGRLLSTEIRDANAALKASLANEDGLAWSELRRLSTELFDKNLDAEARAELTGMAEGLKETGVALDFTDLLAHNAYIDVAWYYIPWRRSRDAESKAPESCSAFVATGSATRDGKPVMGHSLWWSYVTGQRTNVVLDVSPSKGFRFVMDTFPGWIHSGSDFAINAAGILLCETTIGEFRGYKVGGSPSFVRMRKAIQYGDSLEETVSRLREGNNGGYANTWLMADLETNEIGKLELGLINQIFHRSTQGAYYGANFAEDPKLIAEETTGTVGPGEAQRRTRWQQLMKEWKGRIDIEAAKSFLGDTVDPRTGQVRPGPNALCGRADFGPNGSLWGATNAKVTDATLAKRLSFEGRMGFADGSTFSASEYLARNRKDAWAAPFLRDVPRRPWRTFPLDAPR